MAKIETGARNTHRSTATRTYVRIEKIKGKDELIEAELPVGKGWNDGGQLAWENIDLGEHSSKWMTKESYEDMQRTKEVEAKRVAELAEMAAMKKENEELKKGRKSNG